MTDAEQIKSLREAARAFGAINKSPAQLREERKRRRRAKRRLIIKLLERIARG